MAYHIEYDNTTNKYEIKSKHPSQFPIFLLMCYMIFFSVTLAFWPDGKAFIQELIIPGDNAVTIEAFHTMTEELRTGSTLNDAIYAFCCEVMEETNVSS